MFGPYGDSAIEIRIKGPEPDRLRLIASQVDSILTRDPATDSVRNDWQNRSKVIRPQYVTALGRELGVDKQDVDNALEMNFSGSRAGLYREGSDLLPVVVRPPESERLDANHLNNVLVWSQTRQQYIPLSNVVSGFALEWEDPLILRRDRSRVLTVQTDPDPLSQQTSGDILAPLLLDVFFQSMAVVIMFGLGFATILTLLVLPVIYACFHRKDEAEQQ